MSSATRQQRTPVLVVLHADGYVETFGQRHIDARIVTMPAMGTKEGERVADDYLELTLLPRHREIYFPGLIRATGNVQTVTPGAMAHQNVCLSIVRTADRLKAQVAQ